MKRICRTILLFFVALAPCLKAHETEQKSPAPGFRPDSEYSGEFLNSVGNSHVIVYPTIVYIKTPDGFEMTYHKDSQEAIQRHLAEEKIADPNSCSMELDLSQAEGPAQYGLFQSSLKLMAEQIQKTYHVAEEVIIVQRPDGHLRVFGIHLYILDQDGRNTFSFLLNSHHKLFCDARLNAEDNSEEAVETLVSDSTRVALQALDQQMRQED